MQGMMAGMLDPSLYFQQAGAFFDPTMYSQSELYEQSQPVSDDSDNSRRESVESNESSGSWESGNYESGGRHAQRKRSDALAEKCNPELFKTELCRSWAETGKCRYGNKCQFAHGLEELRPVNRHPKFKTQICRTFHTIGSCPYGCRCRFIHLSPGDTLTPEERDFLSADQTAHLLEHTFEHVADDHELPQREFVLHDAESMTPTHWRQEAAAVATIPDPVDVVPAAVSGQSSPDTEIKSNDGFKTPDSTSSARRLPIFRRMSVEEENVTC